MKNLLSCGSEGEGGIKIGFCLKFQTAKSIMGKEKGPPTAPFFALGYQFQKFSIRNVNTKLVHRMFE